MATRIASIESFRVLSIIGVIIWHTDFLATLQKLGHGHVLVDVSLYMVWWVSLPYFFITAGYFFGESVRTDGRPIAYLRRYAFSLVWILVAWFCIYLVVPRNWPASVREYGVWQALYLEALKNLQLLATQHIRLFLSGEPPVWQLWFLPALLFSLATLTLLAVCQLQRYVVPLIVALYGLALTQEVSISYLAKSSYDVSLWSLSLLFTALGWWLAGRRQPSVSTALCLIVGGYVVALMEGTVMKTFFHSSPGAIFHHSYLGGIVLVLGVFLLTLAKPNLGQSTPLPYLAQFTRGVFA